MSCAAGVAKARGYTLAAQIARSSLKPHLRTRRLGIRIVGINGVTTLVDEAFKRDSQKLFLSNAENSGPCVSRCFAPPRQVVEQVHRQRKDHGRGPLASDVMERREIA
jgi:hypothetical protein